MPRHHRMSTHATAARAIALSAEWMVMPQRVGTELRPLIDLAKEQGWRITASRDGAKMEWRGPNGEGPVYTSYRTQGRQLANARAELIRAGLKLDERQAKEHVSNENYEQLIATSETCTVDELLDALQLINANVAVYAAKADNFADAKRQIDEWHQLAEQAVEEATEAKKKLSEVETMLDAIRTCFGMAPWAILPEIAKLLGIDAITGHISGHQAVPPPNEMRVKLSS